jgi:hypothetical protein
MDILDVAGLRADPRFGRLIAPCDFNAATAEHFHELLLDIEGTGRMGDSVLNERL